MRLFVLVVLVLAGCATPAPSPEPEPVTRKESVAVAGLMQSARADAAAGNLSGAAARLERALRIEPRNPRLWHELALVRLRQGEFAQAQSMAARSNSWAGDDAALREQNQRVIDQAREGRR